ncbi:MAG: hypothetical protein JWQ69_996 [Pseudomonas sp.]|nr:hypothetical protein [Pseudomonas sp.]
MNIKFMGLVLAVASTLVHAGERSMTSMDESSNVPVVDYRYGMSLDIAKVLSVTSTAQRCDIGPATMKYLDHAGELHAIGYQAFGNDCHEN